MYLRKLKKQIATVMAITLVLSQGMGTSAWGNEEIVDEDFAYEEQENEASPSNTSRRGVGRSVVATPSEALLYAVKSFNADVKFVDINGEVITSGEKNIPETGNSFPYLSQGPGRSKGGVDLEEYGYVEKEYFLSGNANVYDLIGGKLATKSNAEYVNRIIVFQPKNASEFNGGVYVDILNASSRVDVPDVWRRSYDFFMKQGYVYIGVTSKDSNVNSLKKFDSKRYDALDWKDNGTTENGLIWDMLGQLGSLLKRDSSPLLYDTNYSGEVFTYLTGQSQSGWYVNTFSNQFSKANYMLENIDDLTSVDDIQSKTHIYDGFFNVVGGMMDAPIANRQGDKQAQFQPAKPSPVPYILIVGENDYSPAPVRDDSDELGNLYRHYVVAGASHSNKVFLPDPLDEIQLRAGRPAGDYPVFKLDAKTGNPHTYSDMNMDVFVNGALENLHLWASQGVAAPRGPSKDEVKGTLGGMSFTPERDEYGNMTTGIRSPQLTVPIASYYGGANGVFGTDGGSMVYLEQDVLKSLYGTRRNYLMKYEAAVDNMIDQKWIVESDRELLMSLAEQAPIFNNKIPAKGKVEATMASIPSLKKISEAGKQVEGLNYTETEYGVQGATNMYGVMYDNLIYPRRLQMLDYTNYARVCVPERFKGEVIIDLIFAEESNADVTEYIKAGKAYVGITASAVAAAANGGSWDIPFKTGETRTENGLVWDIISQTVSSIRAKNGLLGTMSGRAGRITLGVDPNESDMVYTYDMVFGGFKGYGINVTHIASDGKAIPMNDLDTTIVPQKGPEVDIPRSSNSGGVSATKATTPNSPGVWSKTDAGWQFVKADGSMYTSEWLHVNGMWYYVGTSGLMTEGWQLIKDKWYYLNPVSGHMATGWVLVNDKWYYIAADGAMLAETVTPDGYYVGSQGDWNGDVKS